MTTHAAQQAAPDARGNECAGAAAARPSWAFSICPISSQSRRDRWRLCGDIRLPVWSFLAGRQCLQSRAMMQQDTLQSRRATKNPRATKRSCADGLGQARSISQKSFPQRIGSGMASAFIARLLIGRYGPKQRTNSPWPSKRWSCLYLANASVAFGLSNTRPSVPKSTAGKWSRTGTFCCGLQTETPRLSRIGSASGGPSFPKTLRRMGCTSRAATKRVGLGISPCTPPKRRSLPLSPSGVGGGTLTATNCLRLRTCRQSACSPIGKVFGGLGCFAGLSVAKSASAGDVLKGFLGFSLVVPNAILPRGSAIKSRPKNFPAPGVMDRGGGITKHTHHRAGAGTCAGTHSGNSNK